MKRLLLPVAALLIVMIGLGLLLTKVMNHVWPMTAEDGINRGLAADRDSTFNGISGFFSFVGSTPCIIGVTVLVAIILRLTLHRWREPLFLCAAVTAQALVFFFTTLAIDRQRPKVQHLDASPPTSSFPSGHTSAAVALYIGLAVVLSLLVRQTWLKAICWALVLVPVAVALARLYRGMHHPSDVTASFFNGITCIIIMSRGILDRAIPWRRDRTAPRGVAAAQS
ncbi:phosphatase PAP2 family protein [Micromonosporaceae bacterium Da 78-11]